MQQAEPPTPPTPPPATPVAPQAPAPVVPAPASLLLRFCLAIQSREGYFGPNQLAGYPHGTPAFVNHNPGNLRCDPANKAGWEHRATGENGGFCVFPDYDTGLQALQEVVEAVCRGQSPTYNAAAQKLGLHDSSYLSFSQYFVVRDPSSDGNDPASFAQEVAGKLGVPISTMMRSLL